MIQSTERIISPTNANLENVFKGLTSKYYKNAHYWLKQNKFIL